MAVPAQPELNKLNRKIDSQKLGIIHKIKAHKYRAKTPPRDSKSNATSVPEMYLKKLETYPKSSESNRTICFECHWHYSYIINICNYCTM